ncbi:hypothetical protein [Candidatus Magnetaquicoccus inordinatus]|uniref:hypothetical protein n=1 Tax=Candidatus Magnetaquicoccus inordinatus TaxID=2496818 RepID=UPI00102B5FCB|nr:hypothetical protein [Candidatus Magnetaquicoccus inordinatus]
MLRAMFLLGIMGMVVLPVWGHEERLMTPSHVYAEALRLEKEVEILKSHFGITEVRQTEPVVAQLQPRHPWQKSYLIFRKINLFRRQHGFPEQAAQSLQPVLNLEPHLVYEQTQRLLTEMQLLKLRLGITKSVPPQELIADKQPADVFNKLHFISVQWDLLLRAATTTNELYAEVKRIDADVDTIMDALHISDQAFPPANRGTVSLSELLASSFTLLTEVQRLQQLAAIPRIDFEPFRHPKEISLADVWNMIGFILAELQTVKASLGLHKHLTPVAEYYEEKSPAVLQQLLGYVTHKLHLIRAF